VVNERNWRDTSALDSTYQALEAIQGGWSGGSAASANHVRTGVSQGSWVSNSAQGTNNQASQAIQEGKSSDIYRGIGSANFQISECVQEGWSGGNGPDADSQGSEAHRGGRSVTDISAGSCDTLSNTGDMNWCTPSASFNLPSYGSFKDVLGDDERASQVVVARQIEPAYNSTLINWKVTTSLHFEFLFVSSVVSS